jgi:hypothetical protein
MANTRLGKSTISSMFQNCSNLINLNIENTTSGIVASCLNAFRNCQNLIDLNIPANLKVVNMADYMFQNCVNLINLSMPLFNTNISSGNNFNSMFQNCYNLTNLYIPN